MKKRSAFLMAVLLTVMAVLPRSTASAAAPYFSNNAALNSIFQQLEKQFLQYPKDEVVPLEYYELIGDEDDKKDKVTRTVKKISDQQKKEAAERKLNELRANIEIKEEELGGLSAQEYKIIADHLAQQMLLGKLSSYGWDIAGKKVSFYLDIREEGLYDFKGLVGNLARMGKEKDQVSKSDLLVKSKIDRYLNQSIQKGNKVGADILKRLPGEVEKLFVEQGYSKIVASRVLAIIHDNIFNPEETKYDGTESVEDLIDSMGTWAEWAVQDREKEMELENFEYPADVPSFDFKDYITKRILNEELSESFTSGFSKAITLDELAKLYFNNREFNEKFVIDDPAVSADSPDYIKQAYIYGMLDNTKNLTKPMTRLEAARHLVDGTIYDTGFNNWLRITDANKIPVADQKVVSITITGGMGTRNDNFDPQGSYTKQEAIRDNEYFPFDGLRGYNIPIGERLVSQVILGKNTIHLLFDTKEDVTSYVEDYLDDTVLNKINPNGKYTKVDTGGAVIELYTPENGVKFTMKSGVTFFDLKEGSYGPGMEYTIEPKVVKASDKLDMTIQPDAINKKLNPKLDAILAKIFKPNMTDQQKVKAIHDYVVTHVSYDIKLRDEQTVESILVSIDKGKGVCGDYALLFMYLCRRASIPCVYEASVEMEHAWNSVFVNGQWLFVDTTWDDDDSSKIKYTYFLKDRYSFMSDHDPIMGVPEPELFKNLDPLKLKSQDEIRAYLMQNFVWTDGYKLTFRVTDKSIKPIIPYMKDRDVTVKLTYDAKTNLYTVTAKDK
ncbi:transglutaminase domain-containing protein [Gorillibacterium timonense]|uniref:transglutaminase domain-containing protein n=1 Tax=Gorillibacterium timonense TaxID=1689269 RepID=UPI00071E3BBF|nr:transglutaminase domain-containing protein [Gorillibacterium timonense]